MGLIVALIAGATLIFATADEARFRRSFGPALRNQVRVQRFLLRSRWPAEERFVRQARIVVFGAGVLFLLAATFGIAASLA